MLSRRKLLRNLSSLPLVGGLLGSHAASASSTTLTAPLRRDYFKELGIRTFINAAGTYTSMTGSLMPEEVMESILYASNEFVTLDELQDKVGERIASMVKCEAATVTTGAASAITFGTAGVIAGDNPENVVQIPHLEGTDMKSEVIMQNAHKIGYAHAIRNTGAHIIYVDTQKELEKAINEKTAMLFFLNANNQQGEIKHEAWVETGKKYGIPTFNDCAADVPPVENLWKYTQMGFDLVCFSGGKGIRGPQSAGLLLGRKDLIAAARMHAPPRGNTVGRGMKVNKEEILGMMVALEMYVNKDHEAEWKMWEQQIAHIADAVKDIDGVTTETFVPDLANHVPTLKVAWDDSKIKHDNDSLHEAMRSGHPSIEVAGWGKEPEIQITTWMLIPGQERAVAHRLREVLMEASA
ncbi:MAG: aminotransferase class V-fold PLP-dependent enzyme [Bacteroidota bacterium]